jgi:hypothetical protein
MTEGVAPAMDKRETYDQTASAGRGAGGSPLRPQAAFFFDGLRLTLVRPT